MILFYFFHFFFARRIAVLRPPFLFFLYSFITQAIQPRFPLPLHDFFFLAGIYLSLIVYATLVIKKQFI